MVVCAAGVELAAVLARAGRPAAGRQLSAVERLAHAAGGHADPAGHAADVVSAFERRQVSAGAERRIQSAVDQRAERGRHARDFARAGGAMHGWGWRFRRTENTSTWAADRGRRCYEFTFYSDGKLKPARELVVAPEDKRQREDFIGDVAVSPDGQVIYAADLYHDSIVAINAAIGTRGRTSSRPAGGRIGFCFIPTENRSSFRAGRMGPCICTTPQRAEQLGAYRPGPAPHRHGARAIAKPDEDEDADALPPVRRGGQHKQCFRGEHH